MRGGILDSYLKALFGEDSNSVKQGTCKPRRKLTLIGSVRRSRATLPNSMTVCILETARSTSSWINSVLYSKINNVKGQVQGWCHC